jgi:hypothetical protein
MVYRKTQNADLHKLYREFQEWWNKIVETYGNNIPEPLRMNHDDYQNRFRKFMGSEYNAAKGNCKNTPSWCKYLSSHHLHDDVCNECLDGSKYDPERAWEYF